MLHVLYLFVHMYVFINDYTHLSYMKVTLCMFIHVVCAFYLHVHCICVYVLLYTLISN